MEEKKTEYVKQESAGFWNPEKENEELIGKVTDVKKGEYGENLTLTTADGTEIRTPSHRMLQSQISKIDIGDEVKIIFKGEEPAKVKGRSPTKLYEVFKKE